MPKKTLPIGKKEILGEARGRSVGGPNGRGTSSLRSQGKPSNNLLSKRIFEKDKIV